MVTTSVIIDYQISLPGISGDTYIRISEFGSGGETYLISFWTKMPLLDINPVIGGHVTTWYLIV
jgi:hypothetical protein